MRVRGGGGGGRWSDLPSHDPRAVRLKLEVIPLDLAVLSEAAREVPPQTVLVVRPYVRVYLLARELAVTRQLGYLV